MAGQTKLPHPSTIDRTDFFQRPRLENRPIFVLIIDMNNLIRPSPSTLAAVAARAS